jgi:hypothetical protein
MSIVYKCEMRKNIPPCHSSNEEINVQAGITCMVSKDENKLLDYHHLLLDSPNVLSQPRH